MSLVNYLENKINTKEKNALYSDRNVHFTFTETLNVRITHIF